MAERCRAAKLLEPGHRVRVQLGGLARVVSITPSRSTMVHRGRGDMRWASVPDAIGLIIVYELMEGPKRGMICDDIVHPDDEVKI